MWLSWNRTEWAAPSKIQPSTFLLLPFLSLPTTFYKDHLFPVIWVSSKYLGEREERGKQHTKQFCTDLNFGQKFESSTGKIPVCNDHHLCWERSGQSPLCSSPKWCPNSRSGEWEVPNQLQCGACAITSDYASVPFHEPSWLPGTSRLLRIWGQSLTTEGGRKRMGIRDPLMSQSLSGSLDSKASSPARAGASPCLCNLPLVHQFEAQLLPFRHKQPKKWVWLLSAMSHTSLC